MGYYQPVSSQGAFSINGDNHGDGKGGLVQRGKGDIMEIYTPVHMDCMCYVSGCNLHGGYNMMLSMVYLGRTLKLMQNGLRTTGIGYNTVKMRFMCM